MIGRKTFADLQLVSVSVSAQVMQTAAALSVSAVLRLCPSSLDAFRCPGAFLLLLLSYM